VWRRAGGAGKSEGDVIAGFLTGRGE